MEKPEPIQPSEKLNLYLYFGSIGTSSELDIPGHSFYQIGLLDSIRKTYGDGLPFAISSYIEEVEPMTVDFPDTEHGRLMQAFANQNIVLIERSLEHILQKIREKQYNKIFLKARFRNLSTLSKKYKDTLTFETIINEALNSGFPVENIFIVDTDASVPNSFKSFLFSKSVRWIIPSIDFPGISKDFANAFIELNLKNKFSAETRSTNIVFYGNIDSSNYKKGHEKSNILLPILKKTNDIETLSGIRPNLCIIGKITPEITENITDTILVNRFDRKSAWSEFAFANVCLNITKDIYDQAKFIPARLYESIIFGCIPVSYKYDWLSPAMSFNNYLEYSEIIKFIMELSPEDQGKIYKDISNKIADSIGPILTV